MAAPAEWRVAKSIFVADDEATAQRYALEAGGPYHFYFKQLVRKLVGGGRCNLFKPDQAKPDSEITPDYVTQRLVLAGTVNAWSTRSSPSASRSGDFGNLVYACHDWKDAALGRRSMELLAEQVMPKLNAALAR